MRAVVCRELRGPEALEVADLAIPEPGACGVLIRVRAAGVNFADGLMVAGRYQEKPHLPFIAPKKYWDLYSREKIAVAAFQQKAEGSPEVAYHNAGELRNYGADIQSLDEKGSLLKLAEEKQKELIHGYYACVSYTDAQIGKLLAALKANGLDKNTIIVLWGDHGWHLGDLGIWTKHTNFEQANRIPLVVIAPGVTRPGTSTGQLAETVDLYPTLAELAGLSPSTGSQNLDGTSLVPVLKNPAARIRNHAYHSFPRGEELGRAIRTERYRLVEWKKPGAPADTAKIELYDYANGPIETRNVAAERAEVVAELRAILAGYGEARPPVPPKR